MKPRKVISIKKYTIIEKRYDNETMGYIRKNHGFSIPELLGHIFLIQEELYRFITEDIKIPLKIKNKGKFIAETEEREIEKWGYDQWLKEVETE